MASQALLEPISAGTSEIKELGSRFLGVALPVQTEKEASDALAELWRQHPQATHICYAYRLGTLAEHFRASDDGEPRHSAGTPILNQLKSARLTQAMVAVVRYYGGTKLGVPGLVRAYGAAAEAAIAACQTQPSLPVFSFTVSAQPAAAGIVYDLARKKGLHLQQLGILPDGTQRLQLTGKGDAAESLALLAAKGIFPQTSNA